MLQGGVSAQMMLNMQRSKELETDCVTKKIQIGLGSKT